MTATFVLLDREFKPGLPQRTARERNKPELLRLPPEIVSVARRVSALAEEIDHGLYGGDEVTPAMIGKVIFQYKLNAVEAVMDEDGSWRCDAIPCLARPLNVLYSRAFHRLPLDRARLLDDLHSAASWLHGEVRIEAN